MGLRGPAPKPTALKLLEGNPGKQKLNKNEPMPKVPDVIPKPPKRLLPEAKKEWKRLAPAMVALGLLTEVDTSAVAELCQNYAYYLAADAEISGWARKARLPCRKRRPATRSSTRCCRCANSTMKLGGKDLPTSV